MTIFIFTFEIMNHAFAIGMRLDETTATNAFFIMVSYLVLFIFKEDHRTAVFRVFWTWLFLEVESAYRFEWEGCCSGNMGDLGELAMAILIPIIIRRLIS
jgi:hypothetical protein